MAVHHAGDLPVDLDFVAHVLVRKAGVLKGLLPQDVEEGALDPALAQLVDGAAQYLRLGALKEVHAVLIQTIDASRLVGDDDDVGLIVDDVAGKI
jgi:hypothetical protein